MKLNTASLADVTLGTPLLCEGTYFAQIVKAECKENSKKTGNNLVLELKILDKEVAERETGKIIANTGGFRLFRHVSLVPTDVYDPNRQLKEIALAVGMPDDTQDVHLNDILNKTCKIVVKKKPADGQYAEGNDVGGFRKVGADEIVPDGEAPF